MVPAAIGVPGGNAFPERRPAQEHAETTPPRVNVDTGKRGQLSHAQKAAPGAIFLVTRGPRADGPRRGSAYHRGLRTPGALFPGFSRDNEATRPHCPGMRRFLPLLILVVLAVAAFVFLRGIGWGSLARHEGVLTNWVGEHPFGSAILFLAAYIATAAFSLPQATLLTVAGGLLFGTILGCVLTVTGATIGASVLLVVVRSAFAGILGRHRDRIPAHVRDRLERDGFSYLLALRLVPLFPFWMINLAAAVAGIRLAVFVPATLLGIAPASLVLSSIGAGVGSVLAKGRTPDLSVLFAPRILLPLLGLAVLSLLPALLRRRPGAHA